MENISERYRCPCGEWETTPRWLQMFGKPHFRRPLYAWPQIAGGFDGWEYAEKPVMTEDQVKHMVDRFLGWRLPEDFNPDGGISFKKTFNEHTVYAGKNIPTGTNLFDAIQATAMVRYMLDGLPVPDQPCCSTCGEPKSLILDSRGQSVCEDCYVSGINARASAFTPAERT